MEITTTNLYCRLMQMTGAICTLKLRRTSCGFGTREAPQRKKWVNRPVGNIAMSGLLPPHVFYVFAMSLQAMEAEEAHAGHGLRPALHRVIVLILYHRTRSR